MRRTAPRLVTAILVAALLVAACGDDDDTSTGDTSTTSTTVGDVGEITVDVLDFPDDAVLGERLHVLAEPGDERFTTRTVERTVLCRRGVTDDGLCV